MSVAGSVLFSPAGAGGLRGSLQVPADKSISHRAAIIGAICDCPVEVRNFLVAADTASTLAALQACGVEVERRGDGHFVVNGIGLRGLTAPAEAIDVGNSGTSMRLLPGVFAGQQGCFTLDGDASLRRRPMDRIVAPLRLMGVDIESRDGFAPLKVCGGQVRGTAYDMPVASAQVKSALFLAGLYGDGPTVVTEPAVCRDHTEIMLVAAGAHVEREDGRTKIFPADSLHLDEIVVPGDFSSAAFFIVAATIIPGSEIVLSSVGVNKTRTGLLDILAEMGARIEVRQAPGYSGAELVSDLHVTTAGLTGVEVPGEISGRTIDELPLVALAGAFAAGDTVVSGAAELKVKESDRIALLVDNLTGVGVDIEARDDGFVVHGGGGGGKGIRGGKFKSLGDHRMAMLGAVAGAASQGGVEVQGFDCVSVSYPGFREGLMSLLASVET